MDFITSLPLFWLNGVDLDSIFVIIDRFLKIVKYFSIFSKITVPNLVDLFLERIYTSYKALDLIILNQRFLFILRYWGNFY
jgi:hypothetical protein